MWIFFHLYSRQKEKRTISEPCQTQKKLGTQCSQLIWRAILILQECRIFTSRIFTHCFGLNLDSLKVLVCSGLWLGVLDQESNKNKFKYTLFYCTKHPRSWTDLHDWDSVYVSIRRLSTTVLDFYFFLIPSLNFHISWTKYVNEMLIF